VLTWWWSLGGLCARRRLAKRRICLERCALRLRPIVAGRLILGGGAATGQLVNALKREGCHQYAAFCCMAVARCAEAVNDATMAAERLAEAGGWRGGGRESGCECAMLIERGSPAVSALRFGRCRSRAGWIPGIHHGGHSLLPAGCTGEDGSVFCSSSSLCVIRSNTKASTGHCTQLCSLSSLRVL
jgi:hypothetical protein